MKRENRKGNQIHRKVLLFYAYMHLHPIKTYFRSESTNSKNSHVSNMQFYFILLKFELFKYKSTQVYN